MISELAKTPRERRREDTLQEILDAAELILATDGLEALTMQRLAVEIGVTKGAFYRHFESKDAIIAALERRMIVALAADFKDAEQKFDLQHPERDQLTSLGRLFAIIRCYIELPQRRPLHSKMLVTLIGDPKNVVDDEQGRLVIPLVIRLFHQVGRLIAEADSNFTGPSRGPIARALLLFGSLHGLLSMRKLERWQIPGLEIDLLVLEQLETIAVGLGADRELVRKALIISGLAQTSGGRK